MRVRAGFFRCLGVAALALGAAVPIAASVADVVPGWRPASDTAIIATRARDVFTRHTPLLGQPSTAGATGGRHVNHPGPVEFWAIAVGQQLDDHPAASLFAVALVNAMAVIVAVVVAARAGGMATAALAAAALAFIEWSLRGEVLVDPWNPFAAVLPFAAFVITLLCAVAGRRWWALVPAALLGSYAAQSHLTFAPLVVLGVVGAGAGVLLAGNRSTWREARVPFAAAVVIALLAWAGPIVDFVANDGGNVAAVLTASRGGGEGGAPRGLRGAIDQSTVAASWRPAWAESGVTVSALLIEPTTVDRVLVGALVVGDIVLAGLAYRRGRRAAAAVALLAVVLLAGGTFVASKLPDAFGNVFSLGNALWMWPASALVWGAGAFAAVAWGGRRVIRPAAVVGAVLTGVVAIACVADPAHRPVNRADPRYVAALSDAAVLRLDRGDRYLFDLTGTLGLGAVDKGVLLELVRRGYDVRVTPYFARSYGWRTEGSGSDDIDGVLAVRMGDDASTVGEGETVVAAYDPPAKVRKLLADAEAAVARRFDEQGGLDADLFPAFGLPTPPSVDDFVRRNFLTMAQAGFLGTDVAAWPETRSLAEARLQPVEAVTLVLRRPSLPAK